jgi:hypothetical protein
MSDKKGDESMKKYLASVCVCAVLFSVGIHGGGMREVSAKASGSYENLAILQDIIRENECQAGMAFLGYTYEGAETVEILEYTRQGEVAAAYPFLQDGTVVDAGGYEIYAIVPGDDCRVSVYPAQPTEEGEYLDDLNAPYYMGQENEIIILRCNVSEIHSNVMVSVQKQNMSVQYHPMVSLKDGHLAAETHCYDFSIYYNWDEYDPGYDSELDIRIAREQLSETDEVSYYLGLGMSLWYTGTEEYIEGRNCPVFVLGTDHEDYFTKEHYYAVGDNVVYYYDPSGDAWLLYAFIPGSHWCIGEVYW